jgi:hypothetical protein
MALTSSSYGNQIDLVAANTQGDPALRIDEGARHNQINAVITRSKYAGAHLYGTDNDLTLVSTGNSTVGIGSRYGLVVQPTAKRNRVRATFSQLWLDVTSLTSASTTATVVTAEPHGLTTGQWIQIEGASPAAYNAVAQATVVNSTTFTYAFAGGTSPATGTVIKVSGYSQNAVYLGAGALDNVLEVRRFSPDPNSIHIADDAGQAGRNIVVEPGARPGARVATRSETTGGVTLTTGVDAPVQRFATALTGAVTITLSATSPINGATFRVVRAPTATGASAIDVGGLKSLAAASTWAEVTYDGTAWRLIGYGTL